MCGIDATPDWHFHVAETRHTPNVKMTLLGQTNEDHGSLLHVL